MDTNAENQESASVAHAYRGPLLWGLGKGDTNETEASREHDERLPDGTEIKLRPANLKNPAGPAPPAAPAEADSVAERHAKLLEEASNVFKRLDVDRDSVLSIEEFGRELTEMGMLSAGIPKLGMSYKSTVALARSR